jgi:hypothetical protein
MTYAIYNLEIIIYAIHLSIYQVKNCISFSSFNIEQFCGGSWMKSHIPLGFLASFTPSSSSSSWQNHLFWVIPQAFFP